MTDHTVEPRYQTFWPRFWAGMLDSLVFLPLSFLNSWLFSNVSSSIAFRTVEFVVYSLSYYAYSIGMHAKYGQTLGKMAARVKVLDLSERKLSARQAVLRDSIPLALTLFSIVVDLPLVLRGGNPYEKTQLDLALRIQMYASLGWFVAELVTMLTNQKRRALHDLIAGSVVVRMGIAAEGVRGDATAV